jgi:hypothetical protein
MTRPPARADGGSARGDGGDGGYRTLVGDASCACRAPGAPGRTSGGRGRAVLAGLGAVALMARRRRRR